MELMRRHVLTEDSAYSDDEMVRRVFARFEEARRSALIDPNE